MAHATTCVGNLHKKVRPLGQGIIEDHAAEHLAIEENLSGAEGDGALFAFQGLQSIAQQIEHGLTNLIGIGLKDRTGIEQLQVQFHGGRQLAAEVRGDCPSDLGELDIGEREQAFAGIGEKLLTQLGSAEGGLLDGSEILGELGVGLLKLHACETGITKHGGEQVIEVVGDASGEHSDTFHFASLQELLFELEALLLSLFSGGDVANIEEDAAHDRIGKLVAPHDFDIDPVSQGVTGAQLNTGDGTWGAKNFSKGLFGAGEILGMDQLKGIDS